MSTTIKPIIRSITLDKPFDIRAVFAKSKRKPSSVTVVVIPNYTDEVDNDPDRVIQTPKNKKAYKEAMIAYEKGDVITIPSDITTADDFMSFLQRS